MKNSIKLNYFQKLILSALGAPINLIAQNGTPVCGPRIQCNVYHKQEAPRFSFLIFGY